MPSTLSAVKVCQFLVALKAIEPPVAWITTPMKIAFEPSVATSGVIPKRVTAIPFSRPPARPTAATTISAGISEPSLPPGMVTIEHRAHREDAGDGEVEAALLDHQGLADRGDREDPGERQHALQGGVAEAPRSDEGADHEQ